DHVWVSKALFTDSGKLKRDLRSMWYHPPQPAAVYSRPPATPSAFFCHRFFLWMPYRIWGYPFVCSQPGCARRQLHSCGLYKTVRRVIDQVDDYYMGTEYLECGRCHKSPGWSLELLDQLGYVERSQFPAVLSYQLALDKKIVSELRHRSLGNSPTAVFKKLQENHTDHHDLQTMTYYNVIGRFSKQATQTLAKPVPPFQRVPSARWLISVYASDVSTRLVDIKSKITSTFGRILKLDSTKRVTKKLAGSARGTAAWATNVGNEHGQILMSVLTATEGEGLRAMAEGLVQRYATAGVPQPQVLYVDRDCCGKFNTRAKDLFPEWRDLDVRLDIWHFMRRLARCVSSESHPLYGTFMKKLSSAIFQWDEDDVRNLQRAKASHLQAKGYRVLATTVELTSKELATHCRRGTRGTAQTVALIDELLNVLKGDMGLETLGVPLFNIPRLEETWAQQRAHVACIQDPPGLSLYTKVGSKSLGGMDLPVYRCARGSTSLESFHLHLNRFIPGESASSHAFQAYLLEGLVRWNDDRHPAAVYSNTDKKSHNFHSQGALVQYAARARADPGVDLARPAQYTGELIGVEYLFSQTGEPLGRLCPEEDEKMPADWETGGEDVVDNLEEVDELPDLTVPPPPSSPPRSPQQIISASPPHLVTVDLGGTAQVEGATQESEADFVGPDGQPGYNSVMALARHLVALRRTDALSNAQVSETLRLYANLADIDKSRLKFPPRHRTQLSSGRFGQKKVAVVAGADSVKRSFMDHDSAAAQWPDVSRMVEAVFTLLLDLHPSGQRLPGGGRKDHWADILGDYRRIRRLAGSGQPTAVCQRQHPAF
ncbi:hypothetical protein EGW08_001300, partial [Elysia chlorotica]